MRFVPADLIWFSIEEVAPRPSATMAMTAATPMIMPSMVSAVRILLRFSALNAMRNVIRIRMIDLPLGAGTGCGGRGSIQGFRRGEGIQFVLGRPAHGVDLVRDDVAVA